jgi:phosphatidylinositol alpha 1,6-mannosyltransferase
MRVAEQLVRRGHEPLVIAPAPPRRIPSLRTEFPVARVPAIGLPLYPGFRVGLPGPSVQSAIADHGADIVHLAGPVMLGAGGGAAARRLGIAVVAVYATDMAACPRLPSRPWWRGI